MGFQASLLLLLVLTCQELQTQSEKDPSICNLPLEKGSCRAGLFRWYYKMEENQCVPFLYGGCEGNDNRFREKILCEEACKTA
ncbi:kunitz-type protease inhibitor 3 [Ictidomys tridecemlineatus]